MRSLTSVRSLAASLVLLAGGAGAMGQTALGDGRGLERDLRQGGVGESSVGNAPRANFMNEVRARNAAVTGNAPNGQSLMIGRPYTSPEDFHGNLATDELFAFRRDSLGSAAAYRRAPQYTFSRGVRPASPLVTRLDSYGLGSDLPPSGNLIRSSVASSTTRPRQTVNPDLPAQPTVNPPQAVPREQGPSVTAPVGTLRSSGAFTSTAELTPAFVGYQQDEGGYSRVTASGLLGVRQVGKNTMIQRPTERQEADQRPEKKAMEQMGLDASTPAAKEAAPGPKFRTPYDDLRDRLNSGPAGPTETAPPTETLTPNKPSGPEPRLPAGVHPPEKPAGADRAKPEGAKGAEPTWEERINKLRDRLEKGKGKKETPKGGTDPEKLKDLVKVPGREQPENAKTEPGEGAVEHGNDKKNPYAMAGLDDETLEILRKAGGEAKTYTTGAPGSLFEVHLKAGEEELAKGRYFDAEERFARALAMRPTDPTVQAARLNAQIGAGLYVSAGTNLRQLYQQHPEVIGVRYTGNTMPAPARLKTSMDEIRENISKARKGGVAPSDETGILLAYLGHQTGDQAAVKEGLAAMRLTKDGATDALIPVLEGVWVGK